MAFKKKLLSFLTSAACVVSCIGFTGASDKEDTVTAASVTGQTAEGITSQMTIGWNLGNSLDSTNDNLGVNSAPKKFVTSWGNPEPTTELIDTVHKGGFNTIRIPTTWYGHLIKGDDGTYKVEDVWMDYVKNLVDYAYNQDMFVILNIHHENFINVPVFTDETLADATAKMKGIWSRLAEEFKDYDQKLIFEGMNEPREQNNPNNSEWGDGDANSWDYINKLNAVFVNEVRAQGSAANGERLLMLPGYHAGNSFSTVRAIEVKPEYGNVALSVHAYNPYFFCMDTSNMANHEYPGKSGYGVDYQQDLKDMFAGYKQIIAEKGVPIVMGEFSASDFNNTQSRVNWAKDYLSLAKDAGIPCVLWDNNVCADDATPESAGEAHGYVYRATNTWFTNSKPVVEAMMDTLGVTGYELPDYKPYEKPTFSWDSVNVGSDWIKIYENKKGAPLKTWEPLWVEGWKPYLNPNYELIMVMDADQEPAVVAQTSTVVGGDNDGDGKPDTGWYYASSDNSKNCPYVYYFTYYDIVAAVTATGLDSMDAIVGFYVSARMSAATAYGLYAVPAGTVPPTQPTTEPTTQATEPTTVSTEPVTEPTTTTPETTTTVSTSSDVTTESAPVTNGNTTAPTTEPTTAATTTTEEVTEPPTTLPAGEHPVPPSITASIYGDVNCDTFINIADVVRLNKFLLNSKDNYLAPLELANADCDRNYSVNASDSTLLMNYVSMTVPLEMLGK